MYRTSKGATSCENLHIDVYRDNYLFAAIQTEQKISEAKNHGITSLYSQVRESVTINEDSRFLKR